MYYFNIACVQFIMPLVWVWAGNGPNIHNTDDGGGGGGGGCGVIQALATSMADVKAAKAVHKARLAAPPRRLIDYRFALTDQRCVGVLGFI